MPIIKQGAITLLTIHRTAFNISVPWSESTHLYVTILTWEQTALYHSPKFKEVQGDMQYNRDKRGHVPKFENSNLGSTDDSPINLHLVHIDLHFNYWRRLVKIWCLYNVANINICLNKSHNLCHTDLNWKKSKFYTWLFLYIVLKHENKARTS